MWPGFGSEHSRLFSEEHPPRWYCHHTNPQSSFLNGWHICLLCFETGCPCVTQASLQLRIFLPPPLPQSAGITHVYYRAWLTAVLKDKKLGQGICFTSTQRGSGNLNVSCGLLASQCRVSNFIQTLSPAWDYALTSQGSDGSCLLVTNEDLDKGHFASSDLFHMVIFIFGKAEVN